MNRNFFNFTIAFESVLVNKVRGILTALGIVFGVAAVIAMLGIGAGAKEYILEQMKLIGTNNIVFEHRPSDQIQEEQTVEEASASDGESDLAIYTPGISVEDLDAIRRLVPTVDLISPEIIRETKAINNGKIIDIRCVGVTNAFFELNRLDIAKGNYFTDEHFRYSKPVCIIGKSAESKLFGGEDAIGQQLKCGNSYFTVVGILDRRIASRETLNALGLRDYNSDVFIPMPVSLVRFGDRARITLQDISSRGGSDNGNPRDVHQVDRMVVRVTDSKYLQATADVISRMLRRRHLGQVDFTVEIPELLLQQEQKTQDIFNLVLAVIAGISLLVGGIGIMNIMLASVYERIKEIGLRRAIGATSRDIIVQFLFEAMLVSVIGGILGVFLGIGAAHLISTGADIPTSISWWSILLSFGVAASIGLVFGIVPAQKAAELDPIIALRSD